MTDADDESGGLFAIEVSSEDEAIQNKNKQPRDFQSEEAFQRVKESYRPKVETGELWKTLTLPVDNPSKIESQKILHAIEELYFFRRYDEALNVTMKALEGELSAEFRKILEDYQRRCQVKMGKSGGVNGS